MKRASDVLRQAFMSREEYRDMREEEKVWRWLQRPLVTFLTCVIFVAIVISSIICIYIRFPQGGRQPFCSRHPIPSSGIVDDSMHSYYFTEYEATQYFWLAIFVPTTLVFCVSATYLLAGIFVAYAAPQKHFCLKVVENNCCASKRGGGRCLATLNGSFAIVFALFAVFLGSSILTFETDCSITLFWCYEVACWGLVSLYGGTFCVLQRKAAIVMDEGHCFGSRTVGMELLEGVELPSPEMEKRLNAGFRSWMGSSLLSSDDDDDEYNEEGQISSGLDDWENNQLYINKENARQDGFA